MDATVPEHIKKLHAQRTQLFLNERRKKLAERNRIESQIPVVTEIIEQFQTAFLAEENLFNEKEGEH
jgi:hypothetical protein